MMATKAKEAEIEEAENFIPCCFRVMRDKKGKTLKVQTIIQKLNIKENIYIYLILCFGRGSRSSFFGHDRSSRNAKHDTYV